MAAPPSFVTRRLAVALLAAWPLAAQAAPCAGFSDVLDSDDICASVEWLKNRSITLGCTTTSYCPHQAVTRASMALFLDRLGTALTPRLELAEDALDAVDPDAEPTVCATPLISAAAHPRQALVHVTFSGQSTGALGYAARPVVSLDGGSSWSPLAQQDVRESVTAAAWTSAATSGVHRIPANQPVRYGAEIVRHSGGADFTQARCQTVAQIVNANGTASPFDDR